MPRHTDFARFRGITNSNADVAQREGRRLLGDLMQRMTRADGGVMVGAQQRVLPDGTIVRATFNGTIPTVIIISPVTPEVAKTEPPLIWIPQGILVTPATTGAPIGWGIPAVGDEQFDPGINVTHWTAGGGLPQAFMTLVPDNGYPPEIPAPSPFYFDTWEAPIGDIELAAETGPWVAFRVRFRNLGGAYTAILAEINDRRDPAKPLCPPLFGYKDIAVEYGNIVSNFGDDAVNYPLGAATTFRIEEKDGTVRVTGGDPPTAHAAIGTGTLPAGLSVSEVVDALEAAQPSLTDGSYDVGSSFSMVGAGTAFFTALLDHREPWIRCGNIDWESIHAEIPTISWTGPQGRSIPPREMAFGLRRYDYAHIGQAFFIDSVEADFQGAPFALFDRCIYARGRLLAVLPNDGYVLGAAVQKIAATIDAPEIYRLVAIAWHRADQFFQTGDSGFVKVWDTTSDIRVWTVDVPSRAGLVLMPEYVISAIYDEDLNPRGWTDRGRHRLWPLETGAAHGPGAYVTAAFDPGIYASEDERCSPKAYWQPWMFNGSGTEAVCLRSSAYVYPGASIGGVLGPVQAIKCAVPSTGSATISLVWNFDEASAILFSPFQSEPAFFAWDYDGDDEKKAQLTFDTDIGTYGAVLMLSSAGTVIQTNELPGIVADYDMGTCWYYDARTDDYICAVQTVETPGGAYTRVASVVASFGINGTLIDVAGGSVPGGSTLGWSTFGGTGATVDWCERDEFCRTDYPHPRVMVAFARYGADYAAGAWYGVHPGDVLGDPASGPSLGSSYSNVAYTASYSTVNPATTPVDWFNFAGRV